MNRNKNSKRTDSRKKATFQHKFSDKSKGGFNKQNEKRATRADIEAFKKEHSKSKGPFQRQLVKVTCKGLDESGKGVVFYQGQQLHIANLLPDEEATIEIKKVRGRLEGKVIELISKNPLRLPSKCKVFESCGGCQYLHLSYANELAIKEEYVKSKFANIKGNYKVLPLVGSDEMDHYRHKNQAVYGVDNKGRIISGFYEEDSHSIVNYDHCLIQSSVANRIMSSIKTLMPKYRIVPYNEDSEMGFLRHVFIRIGAYSHEVMVVLVVVSDIFPGRKDFVRELRELHPEITTIIQNVNDSDTNMVLGNKERVLFGKGYIEDLLCNMTFQISSTSFYQINPPQAQRLYYKAIEMAQLTGKERVLDAYCGTGTIGLVASKKAQEVIGVELNKDAFKDAIKNAKINKRNNIYFYNEDATQFMLEMASERESMDVVIMDPPRSGSTEEFIHAVAKLSPKRVVYVSCNVDTQVRDLELFVKCGYEVKEVQAFDLFPHTKHVESVVLMTRK